MSFFQINIPHDANHDKRVGRAKTYLGFVLTVVIVTTLHAVKTTPTISAIRLVGDLLLIIIWATVIIRRVQNGKGSSSSVV